MYKRIKGVSPYFAFDKFHSDTDCRIACVPGPTALYVVCLTCRVTAPVETVGYRVSLDEAMNPPPPEENTRDNPSESDADGDER